MHGPAPRPNRLVALDFVRGIAVMGILLLNVVSYSWPEIVYASPRAPGGPSGFADDWTWLAIFVLADGKFRGLFSLLFGASLVLFVDRADAAGRDGAALQTRRLGWLALFGLAHYFLIWSGDILFLYAICGLGALALREWPPRRLVRWALGIYLAGALALGALTGATAAPWLGLPAMENSDTAKMEQAYEKKAKEERRVMLGPWPDQVAHSFVKEWNGPLVTLALTWFETLPLMMLGMAFFKAGMFGAGLFDGSWSAARLRRWAWRGIGGGLVLTVPIAAWLWATQFPLPLVLFAWLSPAMAARLASIVGYAALLALLARSCASGWLGERIVAAGRMAFSNYLGTSLAMTFVFHGWGLGLYGRFGRPELLGFVLLAWIAMLAWSKPWLARYRFGPLEWAWRSLTYGRIEPLRRSPLAIATDSQ